MDAYLEAARHVQEYLMRAHWRDRGLWGPDCGVRFNYRVGRFLKSYLSWWPWRDNVYYLQGQGYWVVANWALLDRTGDSGFETVAVEACDTIAESQCDDGSWTYPNREWKGRVATVEGLWASIALLETYSRTGHRRFMDAALRWHHYLEQAIGYKRFGDELAINYFANWKEAPPTPNNSAEALRYLATLASVTGDREYLAPSAGLTAFLRRVQQPNGEFPYLASVSRSLPHPRAHFQCYQYNAFMCLGVMRYYELTADPSVQTLIAKLLDFLVAGIDSSGAVHYECGVRYRHVTYHAAVVAAALARAGQLGFPGYDSEADRVFRFVLGRQRPDGSFLYSTGDYRFLSDRRSYPRNLAMILYHLLHPGFRAVGSRGSQHRSIAAGDDAP